MIPFPWTVFNLVPGNSSYLLFFEYHPSTVSTSRLSFFLRRFCLARARFAASTSTSPTRRVQQRRGPSSSDCFHLSVAATASSASVGFPFSLSLAPNRGLAVFSPFITGISPSVRPQRALRASNQLDFHVVYRTRAILGFERAWNSRACAVRVQFNPSGRELLSRLINDLDFLVFFMGSCLVAHCWLYLIYAYMIWLIWWAVKRSVSHHFKKEKNDIYFVNTRLKSKIQNLLMLINFLLRCLYFIAFCLARDISNYWIVALKRRWNNFW